MSQPQRSRSPLFQPPLSRAQALRKHAPVSTALVRRSRPLLFVPPVPGTQLPVVYKARPALWNGWSGELRFFLTCYLAGLAFFLIMLS